MMKNNPWEKLESANNSNDINCSFAHRQDSLDFMWAKDAYENILFLLHTPSNSIINYKIPSLNGIKIDLNAFNDKKQLSLTLINKNDIDIFYTLCNDLINCSKNIKDETIAIKTIFLRLEKWQYFLKNSNKSIDKNFLKGLIGELYFLKTELMTNFSVEEALSFWKAPKSSVHDFEVNENTIEIKTKSSVNSITISSYEQMHTELKNLYLFVITLNESSQKQKNSVNIYDILKDIRVIIQNNEPLLMDTFEAQLLNYGFLDIDEYKKYYFQILSSEVYHVQNDFPLIALLPNGVENLTYRINLDTCKQFLIKNIF